MMSFFLAWAAVMFPLVSSPGPANIVFASSGANQGIKRSLPLLLGIDTVFVLKSLLIGFGFGRFINDHPSILNFLQLIGAAYIIYLAFGFLKQGYSLATGTIRALGFVDGVIVQLLNAKGWVLVLLMFSLFSESAASSFGTASVWVLVVMLAALNISLHLIWISFGALLVKLFSQENNRRVQAWVYFSSLMLVAIWLLIDNALWT